MRSEWAYRVHTDELDLESYFRQMLDVGGISRGEQNNLFDYGSIEFHEGGLRGHSYQDAIIYDWGYVTQETKITRILDDALERLYGEGIYIEEL